MGSTSGQTIQKQFTLTAAGKVTISFDVKIAEKLTAKTAVAYVKWNGVTVYTIYACDTSKSVSLQVNGVAGVNNLTFVSAGGPVCSVCFTNICVNATICTAGVSPNLVSNGDFQNNTCSSTICTWKLSNFTTSFVPGWIPSPWIQIGQGPTFNPTAFTSTTNYVTELDTSPFTFNTCIRHKVIMTPGVNGTLVFKYAKRIDAVLSVAYLLLHPDTLDF